MIKRPDGFYTDYAVFLGEVAKERLRQKTLGEDWLGAVGRTHGLRVLKGITSGLAASRGLSGALGIGGAVGLCSFPWMLPAAGLVAGAGALFAAKHLISPTTSEKEKNYQRKLEAAQRMFDLLKDKEANDETREEAELLFDSLLEG